MLGAPLDTLDNGPAFSLELELFFPSVRRLNLIQSIIQLLKTPLIEVLACRGPPADIEGGLGESGRAGPPGGTHYLSVVSRIGITLS